MNLQIQVEHKLLMEPNLFSKDEPNSLDIDNYIRKLYLLLITIDKNKKIDK